MVPLSLERVAGSAAGSATAAAREQEAAEDGEHQGERNAQRGGHDDSRKLAQRLRTEGASDAFPTRSQGR